MEKSRTTKTAIAGIGLVIILLFIRTAADVETGFAHPARRVEYKLINIDTELHTSQDYQEFWKELEHPEGRDRKVMELQWAEKLLNRYGSEGWEVVNFSGVTNEVLLKR